MSQKEGRVGPSMPNEALTGGQINQSTPLDQRVPDRTTELSEGPRVESTLGNDTYLPARYERTWENTLTGKKHTVIIEDR